MPMSSQRVPIVVAVVAIALGGAWPAAADPIQLVSGAIFYSRGNLAQFAAGSDGGAIVHSDFGNFAAEVWNANHACFDCVPGSAIDLSQSESLVFGNQEMGVGGSFRIADAEYWIDSLVFRITSGSVMLPDSTNGQVRLSSPFSFEGVISGRTLAGAALTLSLFGTGVGTATFAGNDWFATSYQFAAATPEPGTLVLLGGPALALLRRRRAVRPPNTGSDLQ
jgi:hypothetical protein